MDTKTYNDRVWMKGISVFSSTNGEWVEKRLDEVPDSPILKAWLADDDIQEITICSSNIGFVRTWQKRYRGGDDAKAE